MHMTELSSEVENGVVELLAIIYRTVPWRKIHTSKNVWDIFNHRVRSACRRRTLYEFVSRLCNYFGLQSLPIEAQEIVEKLRPYEREILYTLEREHIAYCVRAIVRAKEIKEEKRKKEENNNGDS